MTARGLHRRVPTRTGKLAVSFIVVFTMSLVSAIMLAIGFWPVSTALIGFAFWTVFYRSISERNPERTDIIFWLMLVLTFLIGFIQKRTGTSAGIVLEGIMLLTLPFLLEATRNLDKSLRRALLLLPVFLLIAAISAILGESRPVAAVFQIVTDLKFPILVLMGFYFAWSERTERRFWLFIKWLWVPLLLLVIWQWVSPSTYFTYIHVTYGGQEDPLGLVPTRALGPYNHSAQFAAVLSLLFLIAALRGRLHNRTYYLPALAYFAMLLGTTQRLEIFSVLLTFGFAMFIIRRRSGAANALPIGQIAALVVVTTMLLAASPFILERLNRVPEFREFSGDAAPFRPRPVYYVTSANIANHFMPLGSGPGTFAGAGAGKFNWDFYQQLGFFGYSWFSPMFMFETYWPHFIAEDGWVGFLVYLVFILALIRYGVQKVGASVGKPVHLYWAIATSGLTYLLLTSFNGPTFEDPETALLGTIFLGIAFRRENLARDIHGK